VASPRKADTAADLATILDATERRLAIAVADDVVENLANAYAYYLDEFDGDAVADLFGGDAEIALNSALAAVAGEPVGAAIDRAYRGVGDGRPAGFFAIHQTLQPVIDVADDGASARVRYRLFEPLGRVGEEGAWIAGDYNADAVLAGGVWRLDRLSVNLRWSANYTEGWTGNAP
jgi:hypothetical protein